jgi:hypothetical protein
LFCFSPSPFFFFFLQRNLKPTSNMHARYPLTKLQIMISSKRCFWIYTSVLDLQMTLHMTGTRTM